MRVFLDANILISYLLEASDESAVKQCVNAAFAGRYTLLLAQPLLDEFTRRVATKPYLARRITIDNVERLKRIILSVAELVPPIGDDIPSMTRDPKDDYLIAYA
jgi:predicted nucleic acid-binding protein